MHANAISSRRTNLLIAFLVTTFCFIFTYLFFGFYFVEYEGLNISFLSGKLTPGLPFRSLYFSGNMGISYFYSFLYESYPDIEWISWIEYFFLFVTCAISLYIAIISFPLRIPVYAKVALVVMIYFLVFADHHVNLLYTRVAYFVCGVSLIALIIFFKEPGIFKQRKWRGIILYLFFAVGTLIRN